MMAKMSAAPARLPTTLPTTCGVSRGPVPSASSALIAAVVPVGEPAVAVALPPIQPGPPPP